MENVRYTRYSFAPLLIEYTQKEPQKMTPEEFYNLCTSDSTGAIQFLENIPLSQRDSFVSFRNVLENNTIGGRFHYMLLPDLDIINWLNC